MTETMHRRQSTMVVGVTLCLYSEMSNEHAHAGAQHTLSTLTQPSIPVKGYTTSTVGECPQLNLGNQEYPSQMCPKTHFLDYARPCQVDSWHHLSQRVTLVRVYYFYP